MLYAYGLVRAGHPAPSVAGIGSSAPAVRIVASGPVAAAVSDVPDGLTVGEEEARRQLHVLVDLLADGPVVPLRLGTLAPDEAQLRSDVVDPVAEAIAPVLDRLDGLVEIHVDVDDDEADSLAAIAGAAPGLRPRAGADLAERLEVGRQLSTLLVDHRTHLADQLVQRLRGYCVDDVPRAVIGGPEDPVLRWAFLVRAEDLALLDQEVIALRADFPSLSIRHVGPLPAAHFVDRMPQSHDAAADSFRSSGSWGW